MHGRHSSSSGADLLRLGLPTELVSSIKHMYQHAVHQPMVTGTTTAGHA